MSSIRSVMGRLVFVVIIGISSAAWAQSGDSGQQPDIRITPQILDLGEIKQGQTGKGEFTIENAGGSQLQIQNIRASCGCTTAEIKSEDRIIPPGGKISLAATFDTRGRRGQQTKTITIRSNDPDNSSVTVTLKAQITTICRTEPIHGRIQARSISRGQAFEETLDVLPEAAGAEAVLKEVELPGADVQWASRELSDDEGRKGFSLRFKTSQDADLGTLNLPGSVKVAVGEDTVELFFRVMGRVIGQVAYRPEIIRNTRPLARGAQLSPITLSSTSQQEFDILRVDAGPYLEPKVLNMKKGLDYVVTLKVGEQAPDGPFARMVTIYTDLPAQPVIDVPVFVDVQPRVAVEPRLVLLSTRQAGPDNARRVRLEVPDSAAKLELASVTSGLSMVRAELYEPAEPKGENLAYIKVWLQEGAGEGKEQAKLTISTNITGAEQVTVPVMIRP